MNKQQEILRQILAVDEVLQLDEVSTILKDNPRPVVVESIRRVLDEIRQEIINTKDEASLDKIDTQNDRLISLINERVKETMSLYLKPVINATGVVIHTNLGRSILSSQAIDEIILAGSHYTNLEYDLESGTRGSRYKLVEDIICKLTGAEAAMVVNNNAGAVLLSLSSLAEGKDVIVSRGELVEIGGSFRIPDVMRQSGANLVEVGSTNKTHLRDYEQAITEETALLLKVHTSNFQIVGFTAEVTREEMVNLGRQRNLPVMEDLGSGILIDLSNYNLKYEPTVQASVKAGVDLITFSGDKLLGGPQAGIIIGKKEIIARISSHPLTRALRVDKFTLAGLEATFKLYLDEARAIEEIPTLKMILAPLSMLKERAKNLAIKLRETGPAHLIVDVEEDVSRVGGGALPLEQIPTYIISMESNLYSPNDFEKKLREADPPLIVRLKEDKIILDLRTILPEEENLIIDILNSI